MLILKDMTVSTLISLSLYFHSIYSIYIYILYYCLPTPIPYILYVLYISYHCLSTSIQYILYVLYISYHCLSTSTQYIRYVLYCITVSLLLFNTFDIYYISLLLFNIFGMYYILYNLSLFLNNQYIFYYYIFYLGLHRLLNWPDIRSTCFAGYPAEWLKGVTKKTTGWHFSITFTVFEILLWRKDIPCKVFLAGYWI